MILTSVLILVGLILSFVGYFFWKKNTGITNHYSAPKQKTEPSLGKNPLANVRFESQEKEDPDVVLGIKSPVEKSSEDTQEVAPSLNHTVVLYLMSPSNSSYAGYELLQALLSAGLRFGAQHIFHRHVHKDGRGDVLFHCASAEKPGTFDVSKMGGFATRGLCFFFTTDTAHEPLAVFDTMLDTIDQLVEDLGGEVYDENHQLFTQKSMLTLREQLKAVAEEVNSADILA